MKFIRQTLALEPATGISKGDKLAGPSYVYFDLSRSRVHQFQDKLLQIYYFSPKSNAWMPIRTDLVNGDRAAALAFRAWQADGILRALEVLRLAGWQVGLTLAELAGDKHLYFGQMTSCPICDWA